MNETSEAGSILPPEQFTGQLGIRKQRVPISLTASAGPSGRLELNFESIPSGVWALLQPSGKPGNLPEEFSLECETSDGKRLTSDSVYLTGRSSKLLTREASLRMTASDTHDRPLLRFRLLGFECFPSVHVVAELGSIGVNGAARTTATDEITGWITAQGLDGRPPMNWRESAEHMLKHLCYVLGFARGAPLPAPMSEFYEGDTLEVTFHETGGGYAPLMPPLPHLNLRPIVETAVNNIAAIDDYQDIFEVAVGWLLVPTTFDEVRFLAGMTALESLASRLLKKDLQTGILDKPKSKKFVNRVRALVDEQKFDDSIELDAIIKKAIKEKIPELNRRSFIQKIGALLEQQQVARTSIDDAELTRLVKLRNPIVHKGTAPENEDLWPSILIIREILVRLIFSMLQFDGTYWCYIEGRHMRRFPDCKPIN